MASVCNCIAVEMSTSTARGTQLPSMHFYSLTSVKEREGLYLPLWKARWAG